METLTDLQGRPRPLLIDGRTYQLHPFSLNDFAEMQLWVDSQFPDPFQVVHEQLARREYTVAQQQFLLEKAIEKSTRSRHLIGTPEADALLNTVEGAKRMIYLSIRKGDPDFTEADADLLYSKLGIAHLALLYEATTITAVTHDPKGSGRPSGSNGLSVSRPTLDVDSTGTPFITRPSPKSAGRRRKRSAS